MLPTSYDAIAAWYDTLVRSADFVGDRVTAALFTLLGDIGDQRVCDLACGQGRIARCLAQAGAQVVAIDLSPELIALAQQEELATSLGITYIVADAQTLNAVPDAQFDGVVCNLALMDIPNLPATCQAVWRVLRPGGWFVVSITHPCFEAPHARWQTTADGSTSRLIIDYLTEGFWRSCNPVGVRGKVGANHRTLATYINTFIASGLTIDRIVEPQPAEVEGQSAHGTRTIPTFMLLRCTKQLNPC